MKKVPLRFSKKLRETNGKFIHISKEILTRKIQCPIVKWHSASLPCVHDLDAVRGRVPAASHSAAGLAQMLHLVFGELIQLQEHIELVRRHRQLVVGPYGVQRALVV